MTAVDLTAVIVTIVCLATVAVRRTESELSGDGSLPDIEEASTEPDRP